MYQEGTLVIAAKGTLTAIDARTGEQRWQRKCGSLGGTDVPGIFGIDGHVWTVVDDDETIWPLHSVWGTPDGSVHAVGMNGAIVTLHEETWEAVDGFSHVDLEDVWGISATDVYVVGGRHEDPMPRGTGVVLHFDGESWRHVEDLPTCSLH